MLVSRLMGFEEGRGAGATSAVGTVLPVDEVGLKDSTGLVDFTCNLSK